MYSKEELITAGFLLVKYEGQNGDFLSKTVKAEDMSYAGEHLVDSDYIYGDMLATTEVTPDNKVQLSIMDADYVEGPVDFESEEGQFLLKDAVESKIELHAPATNPGQN